MIKRAFIAIFILSSAVFGLEGPDFMLLGTSCVPDPEFYNICSPESFNSGFELSLQNASLYDIDALDWNYAGLSYSDGCWKTAAVFRMYGVNDLYESTWYSVVLHRLFKEKYSIGIGYSRKDLDIGDGLYRQGFDIFRLSSGVKLNNFSVEIAVDNLAANDSDNVTGDPELFLSGDWQVYKELSVFSVYYRNPFKHDRFIFGQNLGLNEYMNISAGLISGPEIYFVGFEIVYKRLLIGYTYYDLAGLADSFKFTVSYR